MLLREYASEQWFVIPPLLTNVCALPGKHEPQKLGLFSHAVYQNYPALVCYIFNSHQPVLIIFGR